MKSMNLRKFLLTFTLLFMIQSSALFLSHITEEETYSEEELISPHSDCPSSGVRNN